MGSFGGGIMNRNRLSSSPELATSSPGPEEYDDSALEGVAANVKLLLKLIQDHKDACNKHKKDGRRMLRVATMMTILDNVRSRIQKCQFGNKQSGGELKPSQSDLSQTPPTRESKNKDIVSIDEKEKLRKALYASMAARKSLEIMCSSLGKEKEIMAFELHKRVHQMNEMEELISDIKAQNESLLEKVQECGREHKENRWIGGATQGNAALQGRNKELSEQLRRSLDGYRSAKRKLKEAQEENLVVRATMEETGERVKASLERFCSFKENMPSTSDSPIDIQKEIYELENLFASFQMQVTRQNQKRGGDQGKLYSERNAHTPCIYT